MNTLTYLLTYLLIFRNWQHLDEAVSERATKKPACGSSNNPQIAVRQILENTVKCLVLHWYGNWKVILEPHLESDQRQNSKAFRGSTLANADQVWSTSMTHLWLVLRTDRHTDTHTDVHTHIHTGDHNTSIQNSQIIPTLTTTNGLHLPNLS